MTLEFTQEQVLKPAGFVTIWENDDGVTRITLESESPVDGQTEYVGKATEMVKFGALHFGGVGRNKVRVHFYESGAVQAVETF